MAAAAAVGAYELCLLAAAALAMFLATPQGQQATRETAKKIGELAKDTEKTKPPAIPAPIPDCTYHKDDPDDKCKEIYEEIYKAVNEIQRRINELLEDKLDLFNKARNEPNPSLPPGSGSWAGHLHQAEGWQNRLLNLIEEAEDMGCPVPWDIKQLGHRRLPSQPRGN